MMILRYLNVQGIAGIAVCFALAILLVIQKGETRHWKKKSDQYEQLYGQEQAAFQTTELNYRRATEAARAADKAAAERVAAEQRTINERTERDHETRLADARARAERLRSETASAAAGPGRGRAAPMPGISAAADRSPRGAGQDGLPAEDALTATEQAIQLDELIKWVKRQHSVDPNADAAARRAIDPNSGRSRPQ